MAAVLMLGAAARMIFAQESSQTGLGVYQVRPNFYVIARAGSNIGVQIGEDGVLLVDAGSANMSDQVLEAVRKLTAQPIRYIINTNAEPDHVGGNEKVAGAGRNLNGTPPGVGFGTVDSGATILATEDVLNRMSAPTGKQGAYPTAAWPTETFIQEEKPMYLNDEGIEILRQFAHSDADAIVFFRKSDVIMAGDIIDTTRFPVIDIEKGGSIQGEIKALNQLVRMAIPSIPLVWKEGGTYVVPGHGWIYDQPDVVEYRDMITIIADVVQDMIKQGMTLEQLQAANPTQGFRGRYGTDSGSWTTNMFVEAIYKSLTAKGGK
jgi:glyoxylase-like metal-dependent hydrolase (beta-lactamase superfamily II)